MAVMQKLDWCFLTGNVYAFSI